MRHIRNKGNAQGHLTSYSSGRVTFGGFGLKLRKLGKVRRMRHLVRRYVLSAL